ncbi:putative FAD-binding oxidoreductase [Nemania diffusa]|nr:putative FAD-binding oxidoreductase [Nemania diffusa]
MACSHWLRALFFSVLHTTAAVSHHSRLSKVPNVCKSFAENDGDIVTLMNSTNYEALRTVNWAWTAWQYPDCILQPANAAELQSILPVLVQANIPFAVRSGGHSPHPDTGNINGGVLIDLSMMNQLDYNAKTKTVAVGTGLRWEEVYPYLDQFNVTVVGGRVPAVGVGGLILGGGLSWLSNLYGLVADNVVNYEVVLANGSLVNANVKENPDLYWALKGGGSNFGIVTTFTLATYSGYNEIWGSLQLYDIKYLPQLIEALYEYQLMAENDRLANVEILASGTNTTIEILLTLAYLKPIEQPSIFEPFFRVNSTANITGIQTLTNFVQSYPIPNATTRFDWGVGSSTIGKSLYQQFANLVVQPDLIKTIQSVTAGYQSVSFQPISSHIVKAGQAKNGGNALGLKPVTQLWTQVESSWWFPDDDATIRKAQVGLLGQLEAASRNSSSYLPFLFMNDAGREQDVLRSYGSHNFLRLKAVQQRYDPHSVFQNLLVGAYKLK